MDIYLICKNQSCRFVIDRRVNGKSLDIPQLILKECPACGSAWSSTCPSCSRALTIKFADGLPRLGCCGQRLRAEAKAA